MIDRPKHAEQSRPPAVEQGSAAGDYRIFRQWRTLKLIIVAAAVLIAPLAFLSSLIQKGLWMGQLGYSGVFRTLLTVCWELCCAAFVVAILYIWLNLPLAVRNGATFGAGNLTSESTVVAKLDIQISPTVLKLATAAIAAAAALIFAAVFYAQWDTYLRFRYGGSFGLSDPLFGVDVDAGRVLLQNRHNLGAGKSRAVLEEILCNADPGLAMANLGRPSGLLCNIRAALVRMEDEVFGFGLRGGMKIDVI
jgi:hypothetical protein